MTEPLSEAAIRRAAGAVHPDAEPVATDPVDRGKNAVYEVRLEGGPLEYAVVKVGTGSPDRVRAEPAVMERVRDLTDVPVPRVLAVGDEADIGHPYFVMERVPGEVPARDPAEMADLPFERVCREAGQNLGDLHSATTFDGFGVLEPADGGLAPASAADDWPGLLERVLEAKLSALDGGRFDGHVPALAEHVERVVADLRDGGPFRPVPAHMDYRPGNLGLAPDEDPVTTAVIDWGGAAAAPAAYELAHATALLIERPWIDPDRRPVLREALFEEYTASGGDGRAPDRARRPAYRLDARLRLMKHFQVETSALPEGVAADRAGEHLAALEEQDAL